MSVCQNKCGEQFILVTFEDGNCQHLTSQEVRRMEDPVPGPGEVVEVGGLSVQTSLNDRNGTILHYDPAKERFAVRMEDGKEVLLKRYNFRRIIYD